MEQRFIRNIPSLSEREQNTLRTKHAAIIGCGGLGGYIAELLARAGVGTLTLVDGDSFEETNLNRQLYALPENLGKNKAHCAAQRLRSIDPSIELRVFGEFFDAENAGAILEGADIVMDALDSVSARLLLEEECAKGGLWLIHGAVEGWNMQLCAVAPGSGMLRSLYGEAGVGGGKSVVSPLPALCAAAQCAEAVKKLCGKASDMDGCLLIGDALNMEFTKVRF